MKPVHLWQAFKVLCFENGPLEMVQFVYSKFLEQPSRPVHPWESLVSMWTLRGASLEILQWLVTVEPLFYCTTKRLNELFLQALTLNGTRMIQWFWDTFPGLIDLRYRHDWGFINVCLQGLVDSSVWLESHLPDVYSVEVKYGVFMKGVIREKYHIVYNTEQDCVNVHVSINTVDPYDRTCPICLTATVSVQTHCKHSFCEPCWVSYKRNDTYPHCPVCRKGCPSVRKLME